MEADDVVDKVRLKIEKSKIYRNLEILDDTGKGSRRWPVWAGAWRGRADAEGDCEGAGD